MCKTIPSRHHCCISQLNRLSKHLRTTSKF